MTSLSKLALPEARRVRGMIAGYPGTAKTGSLACLANAGYKLGILDFDNNPDPLIEYVLPEFRENVSIITLEDRVRNSERRMEVTGEPTAFRKAMRALDKWDDGEGCQWGPVADWDNSYVLVWDSLTSGGQAAFNRVLHVNNRNATNTRDSDWGAAMKDEDFAMEKLTSNEFSCNVIVLAHLKMIGPKIERYGKDDSDDIKAAKDAISLENSTAVRTKLYPSALGRALPQEIVKHFPYYLMTDTDASGRRFIRTQPFEDMPLKCPVKGISKELSIEDGLLKIFEAALKPKE